MVKARAEAAAEAGPQAGSGVPATQRGLESGLESWLPPPLSRVATVTGEMKGSGLGSQVSAAGAVVLGSWREVSAVGRPGRELMKHPEGPPEEEGLGPGRGKPGNSGNDVGSSL